MAAVVETKVKAATAGAVATGFLIWLLDTYLFVGDANVPEPVEGVVQLIVLAAGTFISGYAARHTPRNDPDAQP